MMYQTAFVNVTEPDQKCVLRRVKLLHQNLAEWYNREQVARLECISLPFRLVASAAKCISAVKCSCTFVRCWLALSMFVLFDLQWLIFASSRFFLNSLLLTAQRSAQQHASNEKIRGYLVGQPPLADRKSVV